jgi:Rrf2 family iron-sulfur cluster assembly transcriptional regulator
MPVAWRTDYATRIMFEIARLGPQGQASISVIAASAHVPYDFARQIANKLAREQLLVSRRGSRGGFLLARPAEEITMLDIFRAMDEKPTMAACTHEGGICERTPTCPIHHGLWRKLDESIEQHLSTMTLAGVVHLGATLSEPKAESSPGPDLSSGTAAASALPS